MILALRPGGGLGPDRATPAELLDAADHLERSVWCLAPSDGALAESRRAAARALRWLAEAQIAADCAAARGDTR
jgi:hypothetical protein